MKKNLILLSCFGILMAACSQLELRPEEVSDASPSNSQKQEVSWKTVPTQFVTSGDVTFAYRELGADKPGVPVVFLVHLGAVLDNWDPRIVDGFAAKHHVIAFDSRGVGASSGEPADSIEQMEPEDLSKILHPVLVANGDNDRMVPTKNTHDLARRLPNSELVIYPDSGHGGVFQYHADFVPKSLEFLAR